ncbi:MAG: hypothetical protein ACKVQT_26015 [Burkholderiales bacterium]
MIFVKSATGVDFNDTAAVLRYLETDETWRALQARFGTLRIQPAITTNKDALKRLVEKAEANAKDYGMDYSDPQFNQYFFVTFTNKSADPVDLYCGLKGSTRFAHVQFKLPTGRASSDHYKNAAPPADRGIGALLLRSAVPDLPVGLAKRKVVLIEKDYPAHIPTQLINANPPRIPSGDIKDITHAASSLGIVGADWASNVNADKTTAIATGVQLYRCPFLIALNGDPLPMLASAILDAGAALQPGDVILIEQQANTSTASWVPVEVDPEVWAAIRTVTLNGIIVVEPAGNGQKNLATVIGKYKVTETTFGDRPLDGSLPLSSGAIVVASAYAGEDDPSYLGWPLESTNHGAIIDCWAWGESIRTIEATGTASNQLLRLYDDQSPVTTADGFGETSGAAAIVAGAIAMMQGVRSAPQLPVPLNGPQVRDLLRRHGPLGQDALAQRRMPDLMSMLGELNPPAPPPVG